MWKVSSEISVIVSFFEVGHMTGAQEVSIIIQIVHVNLEIKMELKGL